MKNNEKKSKNKPEIFFFFSISLFIPGAIKIDGTKGKKRLFFNLKIF